MVTLLWALIGNSMIYSFSQRNRVQFLPNCENLGYSRSSESALLKD